MRMLGGAMIGVAVAVVGPGGWAGVAATVLLVLGVLALGEGS